MFIVMGTDNIKDLKDRHILLELETFNKNGEEKTAWCVLTPDQIPVTQYAEIERLTGLHNHFITNYNKGDYEQALDALQYIKGQLGADMDSFYVIMEAKIANAMGASDGS